MRRHDFRAARAVRQASDMAGALVIVFVLVVVIPVSVLIGGMIAAAALGWVLKEDGEANHEGSELIATNV